MLFYILEKAKAVEVREHKFSAATAPRYVARVRVKPHSSALDSDCATGKCDAARGVCRALTPHDTCTDAEQNCFEVDLDCGGEECCEDGYTCSDGKFCAIDGDCTSGQCSIPRLLRRL